MRGSSHAGDNDGMKNERLSDKVAAQLRGLVSTQNLQPGDRLPAERALAVQLGVSRTALREAIAQLASQGLLTARVGGGTTWPNPPRAPGRPSTNR